MRCLMLAALALVLAGCSEPASKPAETAPPPAAAPQPPATSAPVAAQPADDSAEIATAPAKTCREAIGEEQAKVLVEHCIQVSPATRPPCNAENSCDMIQSEIDRGCAFIGEDAPAFCKPS